MKILVLIGLCILLAGCGDVGDTHRRTYVISKSPIEAESDEPVDFDLNQEN